VSYRDDRDALVARLDAQERELGVARRRIAELEAELEQAKRPPAPPPPAPRPPPRPGLPPTTTRLLAAAAGVAIILAITVVVTAVRSRRRAPATVAAPVADAAVSGHELHGRTLSRYGLLVCVRLMQADTMRRYLDRREHPTRLAGGWGRCFDDLRAASQAPDAPPILAEVVAAGSALHPLLVRADDDRGVTDALDAEIATHAAAAQAIADRALAQLRPAWTEAGLLLATGQPEDREGHLVRHAVEAMMVGSELAAWLGSPEARAAGSAPLATLLASVDELRAEADIDPTVAEGAWPVANVLRAGAELRALGRADHVDEHRLGELALVLSQQLAETHYNYERR
jgi:hypothetical protein